MPSKSAKRVAAAKPTQDAPPSPFSTASDKLAPLLDGLDKNHVYITHIDTFPVDYKRRIFLIPIVLNTAFVALIVWRLYFAVPKYLSILAGALGYDSRDAVDTKSSSWRALIWIIVKRGVMFLGDWLLLQVVGSWPYTFFAERPENPCTWRWKVGFRSRELVIRSSRWWGVHDLFQGTKKGAESPFWTTKIMPAVNEEWVRTKTGYLMMGKEWDLDFNAMVRGQRALDSKSLTSDAVDGLVIGWHGKTEDSGEWLTWRFREVKPTAADTVDEYGMTNDEGANQMLNLRDKLSSLGKEDLFFRMIEIAQYEGSVPGRPQMERDRITLEEIQKTFSSQGVDFPKLMDELELDWPGLERAA